MRVSYPSSYPNPMIRSNLLTGKRLDGRGGGIRTPDPLLPNSRNHVISKTYRERLALLSPVKSRFGILGVGLKWGWPVIIANRHLEDRWLHITLGVVLFP